MDLICSSEKPLDFDKQTYSTLATPIMLLKYLSIGWNTK